MPTNIDAVMSYVVNTFRQINDCQQWNKIHFNFQAHNFQFFLWCFRLMFSDQTHSRYIWCMIVCNFVSTLCGMRHDPLSIESMFKNKRQPKNIIDKVKMLSRFHLSLLRTDHAHKQAGWSQCMNRNSQIKSHAIWIELFYGKKNLNEVNPNNYYTYTTLEYTQYVNFTCQWKMCCVLNERENRLKYSIAINLNLMTI